MHLYYALPVAAKSAPLLGPNLKKAWPSRLGFQVEYICDTITVAGHNREVMLNPELGQFKLLPKSLYPYNYAPKASFSGLLKDTSSRNDFKTAPSFIVEGSRNQTLFEFLRVENFNFDHSATVVALCCDPPLERS